MKFITTLSLAILTFWGNAQITLDWAKAATTNGYSTFTGCQTIDNQNNIIIAGYYSQTTDFDPGPGVANMTPPGTATNQDAFIAKYDSLGNYKWALSFGGPRYIDHITDIVADSDGSVYAIGYFRDSADFDPGPGTAKIVASFTNEQFVAKYDSAGNYVWAFTIGAAGSYTSIALDHNENILFNGEIQQGKDYDPGPGVRLSTAQVSTSTAFMARFDRNMNFLDVMEYGSSSMGYIHDIEVDKQGNILFTGYFGNTVDFDPGPGTQNMTSMGTISNVVVKWDSVGNYLWAFQLSSGPGGQGRGWAISTDDYGNVYTSGQFTASGSQIDMDPGPDSAYFAKTAQANAYVAKYTANGDYCWALFIGNTSVSDGYGVVADAVGNVYTTGRMTGTTDFDPGPATVNLTSRSTSVSDVYVASYTTNGQYLDAFTVYGSSGGGTAAGLSKSGKLVISGTFSRSTDFDHGPGTTNLSNTAQYGNAFITQYNGCSTAPGQPGVLIGPDTVCSGTMQSYAVSGAIGASGYAWNLPSGWSGSSSDTNITVTVGPNGGSVSVVALNGCGSSSSQSMNVHVNYTDTSVSQASNVLTAANTNPGVIYQWLDCNNNHAVIPGATNQVYTATANGSYALSVTENGCTDTSACYTVTGVGIRENSSDKISVHPNPSKGIFKVTIEEQIGSLVVFDMLGNKVLENPTFRSSAIVDLEHSPKGVYLLRFNSGSQVYSRRIVIH